MKISQAVLTRDLSAGFAGHASTDESETMLDVNPTNPLNVAGFSHSDFVNVLFYTVDGGSSWITQPIDSAIDGLFAFAKRFDPTLAFDDDGNLYVAYGVDDGTQAETTLVVLRVSYDAQSGFSFENKLVETLPNAGSRAGLDKFHLATGIDPASGGQAVYIAYTQQIDDQIESPNLVEHRVVVSGMRSLDFGDPAKSFTPPEDNIINDVRMILDDSDPQEGKFFAKPSVGSNGELYVTWHDFESGEILIDRDLDGLWGNADDFGENDDIVAVTVDPWLFRVKVDAAPDRGIHAGPVLDVDRSSGRLYLTYVDAVSDELDPVDRNYDVFLIASDDGGATWDAIGQDPIAVGSSPGTEFLPWVDIDQTTGSVSVVYYTSEADVSTGNDDVHVRVSTSFDRGETFPLSEIISDESSNAVGEANNGDYLEYIGLAVHDGTVHALWSRAFIHGIPPSWDHEAYYAQATFVSPTGGNVLTVSDDNVDGSEPRDTFLVQPAAANSDYVEVFLNGQRQYTGLLAGIDQIVLDAKGVHLDPGDTDGWGDEVDVDPSLLGIVRIIGDVNEDLRLDAEDINRLYRTIHPQFGDPAPTYGDLNDDNVVDQEDVTLLILDILFTRYGDANLDSSVGIADFNRWLTAADPDGPDWANGDFDGNGSIGINDFNIWLNEGI